LSYLCAHDFCLFGFRKKKKISEIKTKKQDLFFCFFLWVHGLIFKKSTSYFETQQGFLCFYARFFWVFFF